MPSWEIHIQIAKRLNEKLKYKDESLNLFILGNILPDINNCHMIEDISENLDHKATHFRLKNDNSYINFYEQYSTQIKDNPLLLGYYIHLYLDYYWNKDFFNKFSPNITKKEHDTLNIIKQKDFKLYSYNFYNNVIEINDYDFILKYINEIKEVHITKEDLKKVENYFKTRKKDNIEYEIYNKEELDNLLEESLIRLENIVNNLDINYISK